MSNSSHTFRIRVTIQMSPFKSVIIKRANVSASASIHTRKTITERAFSKALQIETCDSARNRIMWNRLKSSTISIQ